MNLKEEETEIEDLKFSTQQFPAMRAFALLAKITKAVGPALMSLMQTHADSDLASGETMATAFAQMDPDQATRLVPEILASTSCTLTDGKEMSFSKKENIDIIFSGRLGMMFKVIGHALKVNYSDFSSGSVPAAPKPGQARVAL